MANKSIFASLISNILPHTDTCNEAGGSAYSLTPKQTLAQYAATGCFNSTFYASADDQLAAVVELASKVEPEFVAKVAIYARTKSHMKDMPALLVAVLSVTSPGLMAEIFDRVIDSPKMLRNFVQIMRSGAVARRSLGTLPKRLVQQWLEGRSDDQLFRGSVGSSPSLADIIKMVHPKPTTPARAALYAYLLGKPYDAALLPELVKSFEAFKTNPCIDSTSELPDVPMDMLTNFNLSKALWRTILGRVSWQTLRMNLNTFARHGVFESRECIAYAARKLRDPAEVRRARVFPYQLMAAYTNVDPAIPKAIKWALHDAMEAAIDNIPQLDGKVWVFPDVSGSMHSPVTGVRKGSSTKVRCIDVAALVAAAVVRKNPSAGVFPFSDQVVNVNINPRKSVLSNAQKLAGLPSGGTNCSAPLARLNERGETGDLVIYISDNESWVDSRARNSYGRPSATLEQWGVFKRRNARAKLVCLDLQPNATTQAPDRHDVLNIGGFSDSVFSVIAAFSQSALRPNHWVDAIERESI